MPKNKKKGITVEYAMKFFAKQKQKRRFMHKTRYGKDERWGYDKKAHQEEFKRIKDTPYDPRLWDK